MSVREATTDRPVAGPPDEPVIPDAQVEGRHIAVTTLAVLALVSAAYFARGFLIPVVVGVLVSYALEPAVASLARHRVPRTLGAALILGFLCVGIGGTVFELRDEAAQALGDAPQTVRKFRRLIRDFRSSDGTVSQLNKAAEELEQAAAVAAGGPQKLPGTTSVQIVEPALNLRDYLLWGPMSAAAIAGQIALLVFLVYFLLASGDLFKRKLVRLAGPSLERRRVTVKVLDQISHKIAHFLLYLVIVNLIVALATGAAFWWIGMNNPVLWGVAAGVLNTVPYFGPMLVMVGSAIVALLQDGSVNLAVMAGGLSLIITSIEGYLLTPILLGQATRMNAVAVFVGVLFWSWLWGIWGALLAVPILVVLKTVADHVEDLKPVGELLGE
ncbi:MAG TPA: AI-2E family transporter [Vicinamibacterales bacterium]|jgi:predicted PurR-regulated permease PerM